MSSSAETYREVGARFGRNLRRIREAQGVSQEHLAIFAGLHRTQVGGLERGKTVPRIDTVVRLAGGLDIHPAELLDGMKWQCHRLVGGTFSVVQ